MESLIPSEDPFTYSIDMIEQDLVDWKTCIGMRKISLPNSWLLQILLTILREIKNHGILETMTKISFHHKILNLINTNPLTNWQVFISMRLNLKMNVTSIFNVVIQFNFLNLYWLRYSYPIWTNSETNLDSYPYRAWTWTIYFG